MPTIKQVQTNFSSGEVDPLLRMRVDTGAYQNGAATLRNCSLLNTGGVSRRAGTRYLTTLAADSRLLPFEFSSLERYVFALSAGRLQVFNTSGTLLANITSGVPWTGAQLRQISYTQAADVMILCHPSWAPRVVRRTGATTFTISAFAFDTSLDGNKIYQPYYKFADDAVTISVSAVSGTGVTITASSPVFTSAYVGTIIRWKDVEILITAFTNTTTLVGNIKGRLEGSLDINPLRTKHSSDVVEVTHALHGFATGQSVTISGANGFAAISFAQINGTFSITVIDDNHYSYATGHNANTSEDGGGPSVKFTSSTTATRDWSEQTYSAVNGYPGAVAFHESRLWFGGSSAVPDGLWASKIGLFFNFDVGEGLDDESIQITIGSEDISNIKHIVSNRDLQIFSASGEFFVPRSGSQGLATITPTSIRVSRQTPFGSSDVTPLPFDGATLFVQGSGKSVREFVYNDSANGYASTDITLLSSHLVNSPLDMAVLFGSTVRGEQYALVVNNDGTMAVFNSARSENVAGWTTWEFGTKAINLFRSVCTLGELIFVAVQRNLTYTLELFSDAEGLTVDSAISLTGSASATWTLGAYYANKVVDVVSSNMYLGTFTANGSGVITLTDPVTTVTAGFTYPVEITTLPVHLQLPTGSLLGMPKRINRVLVGLNSTLSCVVSNNRLLLRQVTDDLSVAPALFTGIKEFFLLGYNREAKVTITQDEPLPLRVLGMNMEVSF
jgi:hypothetical protein